MPRRKSSTAATPKQRKRQLSSSDSRNPSKDHTPTAISSPGTRASKRLRESAGGKAKATSKKSRYFEEVDGAGEDSSNIESGAEEDDDNDDDNNDDDESGYEDEGEDASDVEESANDDEDDLEEEGKKNKKDKKRKQGSLNDQQQHLWREGVKTGLGPGKQVFIEKPKPRGDGGIRYAPDRIHPNTMLFLSELKKNNDRQWLKLHDPDYRTAWKDWESTVEALSEKISEVDETVPELPPKDLVFRIYRDVRFSKDQTPYKTHFSAAWSRTGRKGPYAAYYVQIGPNGQSFVGSGLWMPEAQGLGLLRRDIDQNPGRLRGILVDPGIRRHIFDGVAKDEKKAIKAFASHNEESALKTRPKGYAADNPNIELLRLRSFTMGKRLSEQEVLAPNALSRITELIAVMVPFVTYLNQVVMPDPGEDDEDDEDEEGDDDGDPDGDDDEENAGDDSEG